MERRARNFYSDTEESDRRCHKKKECRQDFHLQYTRKEWNRKNCQISPERRPRLTLSREDFEEDMEKYDLENLSKQESSGKIRREFLYGFHSKGGELRKATAVPKYDDWMRDQGWVRNFDGFWERRDCRYWEKMQYYEKYREWEMELTEEREENKDLERGCECKAKSREKDWNRYERGYDSNETKLPRKPSIDRIFSPRVKELPPFKKLPSGLSRPSKKRSLSAVRSSDIVKCDDGISQKVRTEVNRSDSKTSSSFKISKLSKIKKGENFNTEKKTAHSDTNAISKVSKDSKPKTDKGGSGTPGIENSRSLNWRFTSLCKNSETSFAEVNMINMEVTIVNDSDIERKEMPICKDSLEQNRMKCLKNKDVFIPTDNIEESLPTDEGKETTESSAENDDSSKESHTDAEESNDAMESSKRLQEEVYSNSLHEDGNEFDQTNDNLDVIEKDLSLNYKEKMYTDMIDLNVSQDLFKTAYSDDITEDQQMSKAEEIPDIQKLEQKVATIEQRIAELRAKL